MTPEFATRASLHHTQEEKPKDNFFLKVYRIFRSILLTGTAIIGVLCIVVFVVCMLTGIRPLNVISGSMEPTIPTGSLVLSQEIPASEIKPGDIITTVRSSGDGLITHRAVSIEPTETTGVYQMVMKGDANISDDPEPYLLEDGYRYMFHVPVVGFISTLLNTRFGIAAVIALVALFGLFVVFPGKTRTDDEK